MLLHSLAEESVNTNCNNGLFSLALVLHGGVHLPTTLEKRQAPREISQARLSQGREPSLMPPLFC